MQETSSASLLTNALIHPEGQNASSNPQHGIRFFDLTGVEQENVLLTPFNYGFFDETSGNPYLQHGVHQAQPQRTRPESKLTLKNRPSRSKTRQDFASQNTSTPKQETDKVIDLRTPPPVRQPLFLQSAVAGIQPRQLFVAQTPTLQNNQVQTDVPQATIPPANHTNLTLSVETSVQTVQDQRETTSYAALLRENGAEGAEIQPPNAPQTDLPATSSDEAALLRENGAEGAEIQPPNAPQTDLPATSSDARDTIRRRRSLRKRKRPSLITLSSTLKIVQRVIPKLETKVITIRRLATEAASIIQQIPYCGRRGTYYSRRAEELLRNCIFLLKESAKISLLQ
ncbi:uncharacterized protein LOC118563213 isoform X3 [Fundulus heteroclitus]|uniref:uncharacterized protein LOC118563213 isoform X3 n=1 Tax=Fundulus heteroclitus TaxID=8078 RepID=UPI00165C0D44|nr:uncharacterized protein LOC118563213 isoform X3 [Fundulus heteroclitus]